MPHGPGKNIDWENFEVTWVDIFGNKVKKDTYDLRTPEEKNITKES